MPKKNKRGQQIARLAEQKWAAKHGEPTSTDISDSDRQSDFYIDSDYYDSDTSGDSDSDTSSDSTDASDIDAFDFLDSEETAPKLRVLMQEAERRSQAIQEMCLGRVQKKLSDLWIVEETLKTVSAPHCAELIPVKSKTQETLDMFFGKWRYCTSH